MPIEMPKGLPFSVDTWSPSSKRKRHHFLTHAHKDHSTGICLYSSYPIYSTHLTKTLLLQHYPQLDHSLFVVIEVGESVVIDDPDGVLSVTAFDANHCPGAVMFLFEGNFGNILHTGDCRLTPECLQSLPEKYIGKKGREPKCRLDYVFLDCTFGKFSLKMPSKYSAIRQVINCIWKHPDAPVVYLACDLLGQEEILVEVSRTFGSKIFVDKAKNADCFQAVMLTAPDILSQDASSRFQVLEGFPKLYERVNTILSEARANFQPEPLIIRPSAQWYACEEECSVTERPQKQRFKEAERDQFGAWHVCYSMHSSREELEWALQLLWPKRVVSTTPSCRAMELNYVKSHCFGSKVASDDPLWKLLGIDGDVGSTSIASTIVDVPVEDMICSPVVDQSTKTFRQSQLQPKHTCSSIKELSDLSLPSLSARPAITLFGRARHVLQDSTCVYQEKEAVPLKIDPPDNDSNRTEEFTLKEDVVSLDVENSTCVYQEKEAVPWKIDPPDNDSNRTEEVSLKEDVVSFDVENSVNDKAEVNKCASFSHIGSSKSFDVSLRKLYRSMNVPVPRPLPSLMELMDGRKRSKRKFPL